MYTYLMCTCTVVRVLCNIQHEKREHLDYCALLHYHTLVCILVYYEMLIMASQVYYSMAFPH